MKFDEKEARISIILHGQEIEYDRNIEYKSVKDVSMNPYPTFGHIPVSQD